MDDHDERGLARLQALDRAIEEINYAVMDEEQLRARAKKQLGDEEILRAHDPRTPLRESIGIRSAIWRMSLKTCEELRTVLRATNIETPDGSSVRALERVFYETKRTFSVVRYYRQRYDDKTGTHYSFGSCFFSDDIQDAITRLYYDFEPVIHAIAARFKWQPDQAANLFRKAGSERYILAWSALIAAAEAQTADSSPVAIAAPQDRSAAFTAADSRQPVVAYAKPIDPVPDQFCKDGRPCGPLEGNATELLRAITGRDTLKPVELLKRHSNGRLFVQQLATRKFAVYFQTQKEFNDAGQRLTQSRDSKGKKSP